jgi:predicted HNH restriction endonuclease
MGRIKRWADQREKILRLRRKGVTDSLKIAAATGIDVWPIRGVLSWYTRDHYRKQRISRLRAQHSKRVSETVNLFPDEVKGKFQEGATKRVIVDKYERDRRARLQCIDEYGHKCSVCRMSFDKRYGKQFDNLIHVHHLRPLHTRIGREHRVDPVKDLRPICPNCHVIVHRRNPIYSIQEVRRFLRR